MPPRVCIIGAGAAGCFCAIELAKQLGRTAEITVLEAQNRPLAKVAITGGGRCNLTNSFQNVRSLKDVYPRGDKLMKRMLGQFSHEDCYRWFEQQGVRLVTQEDQCVFPQSQRAMQIVDTLTSLMRQHGVQLRLGQRVQSITQTAEGYTVTCTCGQQELFTHVVVTTGGHPRPTGFAMLSSLPIDIISPVPSLFTFNIEGDWKSALMGTVVENAVASIAGTKFRAQGPLLLTHWGMSGPAILKLSSHAARFLAEHDYHAQLCVNWMQGKHEDEVRDMIELMMHNDGNKQITNVYPRHLTARHWALLLQRAGIPATQRWNALNSKHINKLITTLTADIYCITGRCPFKEEFVTCGGVSLQSINPNTLESRNCPQLYFAGEVLDVDAVTGGFNLQAAWSMGYVVAKSISQTY